ncbi:MAG: recombinase family protein [Alphaproteobacteria bacterium]|nr:recombinase family protein [Alphaproteobacteria bacterium]
MLLSDLRKKTKPDVPKRTPRCFGYPRTSTLEQVVSVQAQSDMIEARAKLIPDCEWMGNFPEQESAAKVRYTDRPVFRDLLARLCKGDILIIWRLDRLERSMFGMVEALSELCKREIRIIVLQHAGAELDLNSTAGKILCLFLAGMAEMENDQRRESTRNALQWRKNNGYAFSKIPAGFKHVALPLKPGQSKPLKLVVPIDTVILEEIVLRIDGGEKLYQIAKSFHERGLTYRGKPWAKFRKDGTMEILRIKEAYLHWRDHPLRAKPTTPGAASAS